MSALDLLRSGDLAGALDRLKQEVRQAPRDARLRTFLFQLFCVTGAWDRALNQLAVAAELDPAAGEMAQAYRAAIRCEVLRERVFAGRSTPTIMGDPEPWMPLLVEANRLLAAGSGPEAARLRDEAFDGAPASAGRMGETGFAWIADADQRLGPMLEAMVDGRYFWVPFARVRVLAIDPPADLRDQVWLPARFTWSNGGESAGFVPTRYPGSAQAADPALALSRRTEFQETEHWVLGLGQRMLATDAAETALMDVRRIDLVPDGVPEGVPEEVPERAAGPAAA